MPTRSLLLSNYRKYCCNTLLIHIRYGSNFTKGKGNNFTKVQDSKFTTGKQRDAIAKVNQSLISKIQKKFPLISSLYSLVIGGFRAAYVDYKRFLVLSKKITNSKVGRGILTIEEILFHQEFQQNFRKLLPLGVLGILPFGNGFIIPLVYFFPRHTVTPHFWTENQKVTFPYEEYQTRTTYHELILNDFKSCRSSKIPDNLVSDWRNFIKKLQSGKRAEPSEVLLYSSLFNRSGPFYLQLLPSSQLKHISGAYGLHLLLPSLRRVVAFCRNQLLIDKKIKDAGGPAKLPLPILSKICFVRGVNAMDMSDEEKIEFLQKWLKVNEKTYIGSCSLMLYTPFLLGYSHLDNKFVSQR